MSLTIPARSLAMRWNAIACAIAIFIWSTPEEDRPVFVAILSVWLALTILVSWATGRFANRTFHGWPLAAALLISGGATGLAANIFAVLLMVLKDARHAHLFPDYPPALLGAMLARLPAWMLAGVLSGLGVALFLAARERRFPDTASSSPPRVL